jgi:uncharacterized protein YyaL (SSP411 family)
VQAAMQWLCVAQDSNGDGGVALRYSMIYGWDASYPETTGYIIPTFIDHSNRVNDEEYLKRAVKMADWLLSIQKKDGSFNGGAWGSGNDSFVFDTGQIIFGLLAAYKAITKDRYLEGAVKAGRWLVNVQDSEGMWKKHTFYSIPHAYYTRVAWALAELGKYISDNEFICSACKNIDWALTRQQVNGWFEEGGFTKNGHSSPYTHTIAYTIEGILGTGICVDRKDYLHAAEISAEAIIESIQQNGFLAGTFNRLWKTTSNFSCLTGSAQIALILLRLYEIHKKEKYLSAANSLINYLCSLQVKNGAPELRGALGGSSPVWGKYQRFAFPNWAAKFFVDALALHLKITGR